MIPLKKPHWGAPRLRDKPTNSLELTNTYNKTTLLRILCAIDSLIVFSQLHLWDGSRAHALSMQVDKMREYHLLLPEVWSHLHAGSRFEWSIWIPSHSLADCFTGPFLTDKDYYAGENRREWKGIGWISTFLFVLLGDILTTVNLSFLDSLGMAGRSWINKSVRSAECYWHCIDTTSARLIYKSINR